MNRLSCGLGVILLVSWIQTQALAESWSVIAYSPSTAQYGFAFGKPSQAEANRVAIINCRAPDARVVVSSKNNWWCALARGENRAWGAAYGPTAEIAESRALAICRKRATQCEISVRVQAGEPAVIGRPQIFVHEPSRNVRIWYDGMRTRTEPIIRKQ